MKTKFISHKVIKDALNVCGGMYCLNAPHARGYGFNYNAKNTEVYDGMFINNNVWDDEQRDCYDGYIDFKTKTLTDNKSKEIIKIA